MSSFELRTIDRNRLYTSIVDQIVEGIRSGAFPPGAALPAERVLADRLGVSRGSVREAIRVLEHAGILDVRTGSGTYVDEDGVSKTSALRAHAAALGDRSPLDVMIARRALEPLCARLAAQHRSSMDVAHIERSVADQAGTVASGGNPDEIDLAFHHTIAAASRNPVLTTLVEQLVQIMRQGTWRELKGLTRSEAGSAEIFIEQHRMIARAITDRDPDGAERAMAAHLDAIESKLLEAVN
jgi:GntR family transcriptional repressor for pyruvate dehydrogenase complex